MNGGDTDVPSCIKLEPKKSHSAKCIESSHKSSMLRELLSFDVRDRE